MDDRLDNTPDEPQALAPQPLRDALAALSGPPAAVPPAVDAAVLAYARRSLTPRCQARRALRWAAAAVAAVAAAVLLFAITLGPMRDGPGPVAMRPAHAVAEALAPEKGDVNRDGRVDILDAFAVARCIQANIVPRPEWDLTADGRVDRRDVEAIARAAVRLERGAVQ